MSTTSEHRSLEPHTWTPSSSLTLPFAPLPPHTRSGSRLFSSSTSSLAYHAKCRPHSFPRNPPALDRPPQPMVARRPPPLGPRRHPTRTRRKLRPLQRLPDPHRTESPLSVTLAATLCALRPQRTRPARLLLRLRSCGSSRPLTSANVTTCASTPTTAHTVVHSHQPPLVD